MRKVLKLIDEIAGGEFAGDIEAAIDEVVAACRVHEKKGTVSIKIEIEPDDRSPDGIVFRPDVSSKPPKRSPRPSLFYRTAGGGFSRFDPAQKQIPGLQRVNDDATPAETVDTETGEIISA